MRLWLGVPAAAIALVASCSKAPLVNVEVTTGQEKGSLSADPKVVRVDIFATTPDGKTALKASAAPGGSFNLGEAPDNAPLQFCLTGVAADGTKVARGRSISVPIGLVALGTVSLFLQRLGPPVGTADQAFARPNGGLVHSHVRGQAAVFQERYLLLTGGDSASDQSGDANTRFGDFYDLLAGDGAIGGSFTRSAGALVVRDQSVLVVGPDSGGQLGATWLNLSTQAQSEATVPDGLLLADIVGGRAIDTPSGATWIVGATRDDPPTAAILVVGADSTLSSRTLLSPRSGAAAAWVNGGLVVAGGNADSAGVEFITEAGAANALPAPKDATKGASIATYLTDHAVLAGGALNGIAAPTRTVSLVCPTQQDCVPTAVDEATIKSDKDGAPLALTSRTQAFAIQNAFIVVGDDASGQTHAFRLEIAPADGSPPSATELPLHDPRIGATAIPAPNGTLAIMGGQLLTGGPATSVEFYFPDGDQVARCSAAQ